MNEHSLPGGIFRRRGSVDAGTGFSGSRFMLTIEAFVPGFLIVTADWRAAQCPLLHVTGHWDGARRLCRPASSRCAVRRVFPHVFLLTDGKSRNAQWVWSVDSFALQCLWDSIRTESLGTMTADYL